MADVSRTRAASANQRIMSAAYGLFMDVGFVRTTYAAIAERAGFERTLVQYHVPKKADLAARFLDHVLATSERVLAEHDMANRTEPISYRYVLAQVYFAVLSRPELRAFSLEALDLRSVVRQVFDKDIEWNLRLIDYEDADRQALIDDAVMAVGGAYELFIHRLRSGRDTEPADLASRTLLAAVRREAGGDRASQEFLAGHTLSPKQLGAASQLVATYLRAPQP